MNQNHHTLSDSDNMAATAAYHDQMAGSTMAMGMGQSNMYGDAAFYQIDPATFDSQNAPPIDPNQTPLLNNGESDFLQSFFDDPEQLNPFQFSARPDEKPALNGDHIYGATFYDPQTGTINPAGSAAQPQSHQKSHVSSTAQPTYSGGQQDALSADDYRAAHTIGNLKEHSTLAPNQTGFAGSWGNFMMPALNANLDMPGFSGAFSSQNNHMQGASQPRQVSVVSQPQQGLQHTSNIHQKHFFAQAQPAPPPQQTSRNQSVDSASQHARQQQQSQSGLQGSRSTSSGLTHGHRPPLAQWGSDPRFGSGPTFIASNSNTHQNKAGNLLNIYGAQQAAIEGQIKSTGRGNSMTSPTGGSAWGSMTIADHSRKRRKSHVDREDDEPTRFKTEDSDEDDYADAGKSASKRRKSGYNRQSLASNSPAADDDELDDGAGGFAKKRGSKKSRETLSEAQKRDNHIKSEKKRREIITTGYSDLNRLVPLLAAGKSGLSRSECLGEVCSYLRSLVSGTTEVMNESGTSNAEWENFRISPDGQRLLASL